MIASDTYTLISGIRIPKLGLGTWMVDDGEAAKVVRDAAAIGYRHFDTAQDYGNERGVGDGVRSCGIPRDQLFVTTKLKAAHKTYGDATAAIDGSLEALGLDHVDLMIIHCPTPWTEYGEAERYLAGNLEAWRALEAAQAAGKLRAIGVSNFERVDLDNILDNCAVKPEVNQILAHVGNTPFDLIDYSTSRGMLVEAYSPMGHGELMRNPSLVTMAGRYGVSVAQLCIRYCLQIGLLPLPKTTTPAHMRDDINVDFEISSADMVALRTAERIRDYGKASHFPVFGGRLLPDGTLVARN